MVKLKVRFCGVAATMAAELPNSGVPPGSKPSVTQTARRSTVPADESVAVVTVPGKIGVGDIVTAAVGALGPEQSAVSTTCATWKRAMYRAPADGWKAASYSLRHSRLFQLLAGSQKPGSRGPAQPSGLLTVTPEMS